jgi:ABC-type Zn uptake system ZnuABC Zn-binding protein ZnuA
MVAADANENDFQYDHAVMLVRLAIALVLVAAVAVVASGEDGAATGGGERLTVVATTTQAADLARNAGGGEVEVIGLLAPNADPHDYEVRPHDLQALAEADLVVRSGGDVDEWLHEAVEGAGSDAPVLTLIDHVRARPDDPHWWQDPRKAIAVVAAIERALGTDAARYRARLERLDRAVAACIAKVPPVRRKLVTTHDALAYYARRYGIDVVGAVIPSLSTRGQPSAGETADLVRTIREHDVRAIFAESSVDAKVERAIARETGAVVGRPLWADTLGPPGSSGATYVDSIAANTRALVEGFTGGRTSCDV